MMPAFRRRMIKIIEYYRILRNSIKSKENSLFLKLTRKSDAVKILKDYQFVLQQLSFLWLLVYTLPGRYIQLYFRDRSAHQQKTIKQFL